MRTVTEQRPFFVPSGWAWTTLITRPMKPVLLEPTADLTAKTGQQILWMNGFGEDLKFVALDAGAVQQVRSGCLT